MISAKRNIVHRYRDQHVTIRAVDGWKHRNRPWRSSSARRWPQCWGGLQRSDHFQRGRIIFLPDAFATFFSTPVCLWWQWTGTTNKGSYGGEKAVRLSLVTRRSPIWPLLHYGRQNNFRCYGINWKSMGASESFHFSNFELYVGVPCFLRNEATLCPRAHEGKISAGSREI